MQGQPTPVEPIERVFSNRDALKVPANQTVGLRISERRFWTFVFSRERRDDS